MIELERQIDKLTWRTLRGLFGAYGLPFNPHRRKTEIAAQFKTALFEQGHFKQHYRALNDSERQALLALREAGGMMRRSRFVAAFGDIRPYRPWRADSPRQPWKQPISVAERLAYFGFVIIEKGIIYLPTELTALLPPRPKLKRSYHHAARSEDGRYQLVRNLALLIGLLHAESIQPMQGRWLPPWALKRWAEWVGCAADVHLVRSELGAGRLCFLHYLAECAGLIGLQDGLLKPVPSVWAWLEKDRETQIQELERAVYEDLQHTKPLWVRYRLPECSPTLWKTLLLEIEGASAGQYRIDSLQHLIRLKNLDEPVGDLMPILAGPLTWIGRVAVNQRYRSFERLPDLPEPVNSPTVKESTDGYTIHLSPAINLRPLTEMAQYATFTNGQLQIDSACMRRMVEDGKNALDAARLLSQLIGQTISTTVYERLQHWEKQAEQLELRPALVLHASDSALMQRILSDQTLRRLIERVVSAHHMIVRANRVDALRRELARRGLMLTEAQHKVVEPFKPTSPMLLNSEVLMPPTTEPLERVKDAFERAYRENRALTLDYFSPARGELTRRTLEPVVPPLERGGLWYVEAWCQSEAAERTFRLDRVVRLIDS